ncbi:MAG: Stp1/IreP family PP2C-type Ser/Thr phosphatase [Chloroflexota bacterium]
MNQLLDRSYQQGYCHCNVQQGAPWHMAPLLLWWQPPPQTPQWFWFIIASSPIVVLILLLVVAIVLLLLVVWLRSRRRPQIDAGPPLPPASPLEAVHSAETLAAAKPIPAVVEAPLYDKDKAKTQPSPLARAADKEAIPPTQEPQTLPISGRRPPRIGWKIAGLTDMGLKRDLNEDNLLMVEAAMPDQTPYGLYVVADGLGGHMSGEVASQLTVEAIESYFTQRPPASTAAPFEDWLKAAAMAANLAVLAQQTELEQAKKMGSTVVMALVVNGQAYLANVGDSRAYHLDQDAIRQITVDHSLVERLVQIGQLTREEARTHKNRNVLYNSLGDKPEVDISTYHTGFQPGDRLLLCSDGLSGMITDEEILNLSLSQADPARACRLMIEAAKSAGGTDNITAIIVEVDQV